MLERLKGLRYAGTLAAVAALAACALLLGHSGGGDALEARMARVLSQVEGAGQVSVLLSRGPDGETVTGAVIVAQGADSVRVQLELQRAVRALLGLELDAIEVLDMKEASRWDMKDSFA